MSSHGRRPGAAVNSLSFGSSLGPGARGAPAMNLRTPVRSDAVSNQFNQSGNISPNRPSRASVPYRNASEGVSAILGGSPTRSSSQRQSRASSRGYMGHEPISGGRLGSPMARASAQPQQATSSDPISYSCTVLASSAKGTTKPMNPVVGSGCVQGHRPTMEDAHFNLINAKAVDGHQASMIGILDGHCGKHVADIGAQVLPDLVFSSSQLGQNNAQALVEAVVNTDRQIFQQIGQRDGGATLICALLVNRMLFVANLGDARAVLCDGGQAIPMSVDHKPGDPAESQRVSRCGGFVHFGRVGGCLAVSRALGDFEFKFSGQRYVQKEFQVSNVADIRQINITDASRFLILACDGLWDVISNEDAVGWVSDYLQRADMKSCGGDLSRLLSMCAQQLCEIAIAKGSMDNVSVTLMMFHNALTK